MGHKTSIRAAIELCILILVVMLALYAPDGQCYEGIEQYEPVIDITDCGE